MNDDEMRRLLDDDEDVERLLEASREPTPEQEARLRRNALTSWMDDLLTDAVNEVADGDIGADEAAERLLREYPAYLWLEVIIENRVEQAKIERP